MYREIIHNYKTICCEADANAIMVEGYDFVCTKCRKMTNQVYVPKNNSDKQTP